ncbi:MAG: TraR/DksA family transcriptional regulator [Bacteriovoracaceae bacterium]|nr:TraR/DksA family transcriptional regulator [Bacteriovoracaceae bacterium]
MGSKTTTGLTKSQISILKDKLLTDSERIKENFKEKKREYLESRVEIKDDVDAANDAILITTDMRFTNREAIYLKKIIKALTKFENDEYGICEECGCGISFERLRARPTSEMCIGCKEESEKEELHSIHHKKSKSLGKTLNFARS